MLTDGILAFGEPQRLPRPQHRPLAQVESQPAPAQKAVGRALLPAQMGRHPRPQFRDAEGLCQIVVPAHTQTGAHVCLLRFCGEEQARAVRQTAAAAAAGSEEE